MASENEETIIDGPLACFNVFYGPYTCTQRLGGATDTAEGGRTEGKTTSHHMVVKLTRFGP